MQSNSVAPLLSVEIISSGILCDLSDFLSFLRHAQKHPRFFRELSVEMLNR